MIQITQVMIADEDAAFVQLLRRTLAGTDGFSVVHTCQSGEGLMEAIRTERPDILVLDLMLPGINALSILHTLSSFPAEQRPRIFVLSAFSSSDLCAECDRLGVNFFLRKPISVSALVDLIVRYGIIQPTVPASPGVSHNDLMRHIITLLSDMQFPAHVMGYGYIRDAISMTLEDPALADSVTKILYPAIAKHYRTTWTSVERDIRNAIDIAWRRCGGTFSGFHFSRRPANREFILTLADRVRYDLRLDLCAEIPSPRRKVSG